MVQHREIWPKNPASAWWRWYDGLLSIHRRGRDPELGTTWGSNHRLVLLMDLLLR